MKDEIIQSGVFDQEVIDLIHTMEYYAPTNQWYILTNWTDKVDFDFELLQKYFDIIEHEAEILEGHATFIGMIPRKPSGRTRIRAHFIDSAVGLMVFEKFYKPGFTVQTKSDGLSLMPAANIKPMIQPAIVGEAGHEIIIPAGRVYPKYKFGTQQRPVVQDHDIQPFDVEVKYNVEDLPKSSEMPDLKLQETADYYNKRLEEVFFTPKKIAMKINFSDGMSDLLRQSREAFQRYEDAVTSHRQLEANNCDKGPAGELPAPQE